MRKIRRKKTVAIAALALCLLVGGVAAVTLSNMISTSSELVYPETIVLSWAGTGFPASAAPDTIYTEGIIVNNLDATVDLEFIFELTGPNGISPSDFEMSVNTVPVVFWQTGPSTIANNESAIVTVVASATVNLSFQWVFGAPDGSYSMTVYAILA